MMQRIATALEGPLPAGSADTGFAERKRRLMRVLLGALDRLCPPSPKRESDVPPPEWFKYPPF